MRYTYATGNIDIAAFLLHKGYRPNRISKHTYTTKHGVNKPSSEWLFELPDHPNRFIDEWEVSPEFHFTQCRVALKAAIQKLFASSSSSLIMTEQV